MNLLASICIFLKWTTKLKRVDPLLKMFRPLMCILIRRGLGVSKPQRLAVGTLHKAVGIYMHCKQQKATVSLCAQLQTFEQSSD